jgi:hypothetical protein
LCWAQHVVTWQRRPCSCDCVTPSEISVSMHIADDDICGLAFQAACSGMERRLERRISPHSRRVAYLQLAHGCAPTHACCLRRQSHAHTHKHVHARALSPPELRFHRARGSAPFIVCSHMWWLHARSRTFSHTEFSVPHALGHADAYALPYAVAAHTALTRKRIQLQC